MEDRKLRRRRTATEAWIKTGLIDFYVAYLTSDLINFPLIASQAPRYDDLPNDPDSERAVKWVDDFARSLGHNLEGLIGLVSAAVKTLEPYLRDRGFISLLTMAYEEGRYPVPPSESIAMKHGYAAQVTHRNEEKAFKLGCEILAGVERDFGISVPVEKPILGADPKTWAKFVEKWKKSCGS
jgi:hypothetical protein